jgi:hypothetical protein
MCACAVMAGATSPTRRQRSEQVAQLVFTSDGAPLSKPEDVIGLLGKQEQYWKLRLRNRA